jgi:hypothetical protein
MCSRLKQKTTLVARELTGILAASDHFDQKDGGIDAYGRAKNPNEGATLRPLSGPELQGAMRDAAIRTIILFACCEQYDLSFSGCQRPGLEAKTRIEVDATDDRRGSHRCEKIRNKAEMPSRILEYLTGFWKGLLAWVPSVRESFVVAARIS